MNLILSLFPYGLPIIIFIAAARLVLIYDKFNLSIMNFLDFPLIMLHVLRDLYALIYLLLFSMLMLIFEELFIKILYSPITLIICAVLFPVLFARTVCLYRKKSDRIVKHFRHFVILGLLAYFSISCAGIVVKNLLHTMDSRLLLLFMVVLYSFIYVHILAKYAVEQIKINAQSRTTITFKKDIRRRKFVSTDKIYPIGNTTNYIFIYDEDGKKSTSYPMSDVLSISNEKAP
jgi:hypothetical protein